MTVSSMAEQAEIKAYNKLLKKLSLASDQAWAKPAGFATDFPDFGFRFQIALKKVDIWVEYKADAKAQMGSMRDWIFDGNKFSTPNSTPEKEELIEIMNNTNDALQNAKRILSDLKKYADNRITKIYSGTMTIENDKIKRRQKLINFSENTKNYQIAKINNTRLGDGIINHYVKKFKSGIRNDADYSMLLMMIGNEIWYVSEVGNLSVEEQKQLLKKFNTAAIPTLANLKAQLEVRIQPRGFSSPDKPVSIDVMASFRLSGKPSSGLVINGY
jgi:hypothetical protein